MCADIKSIINHSFLARAPEIMSRGGFTLEQAIEQAYNEEESLCLELCDGGHTERARLVLKTMSDYVYHKLRN